jgi:hypothetical protein
MSNNNNVNSNNNMNYNIMNSGNNNNIMNSGNNNNMNSGNNNKYASNNNFKGCPALMSDGRFLTNYKPNSDMNKVFENTLSDKPLSSWEYKYHLTNNSKKVFDLMNNNYNNMYGCSDYGYEIPLPSVKQDCNQDNCVINNTGNKNGIGLY